MARWASKIGILTLACATLALAGCAPTTTYPLAGAWTQDVRVSVDGRMGGSKEGKACAQSWFGVFAMGDASVATAAANGGITNVKSVEALMNARIIFGRYCTIVRGD